MPRNRPQSLAAPAPARIGVARRLLFIALAVAAMAVAAHIEVPLSFSPVPMTLQGLAVLLIGGALGAADGAAALVIYLVLGLAGMPVFAHLSGPAALFGPTGGYLLAFPVAAAFTGWAVGRAPVGSLLGAAVVLLGAVGGMVLIHLGGWAQLAALTGSPAEAFRIGTVPFIPLDLIKAALAGALLLVGRSALPRLR